MMIQPKVTRTRVAKSKIFDLDKDSALAKSSCCRHPSSTLIFRCAAALFCALLLALAVVFFDKIQYACIAFLELVAGLGFWGMVLLGLVNVLCCCFLLPSLIFTLAAGFLYGVVPGVLLISISSTVSMCVSFLIARYMARATVERSFGQMARFQHLDRAIRDEGFTLILLIRCSPVHPFAILNYLFGVTSVSFSDYTVASFIGMFPSTVMEVFFGSGLKNVADLLVGHVNKQDEQFSRIYFWIGLGVTIVSTLWVTIWVKRKLDTKLQGYQTVVSHDHDSDERLELIDGSSSPASASSASASSSSASGSASTAPAPASANAAQPASSSAGAASASASSASAPASSALSTSSASQSASSTGSPLCVTTSFASSLSSSSSPMISSSSGIGATKPSSPLGGGGGSLFHSHSRFVACDDEDVNARHGGSGSGSGGGGMEDDDDENNGTLLMMSVGARGSGSGRDGGFSCAVPHALALSLADAVSPPVAAAVAASAAVATAAVAGAMTPRGSVHAHALAHATAQGSSGAPSPSLSPAFAAIVMPPNRSVSAQP